MGISLAVKREQDWERIMDVSQDEMDVLVEYNIVDGMGVQHPDETYMTRQSDDDLDNGIRDIYIDEDKPRQLRLNVMLIVYRLRAWTQEGDVLVW